MTLSLTPAELARRRPIWTALAALFLDTELEEADYRHLARVLRDSGCSPDEWRTILRDEVAPVVGGHLLGTAGEWAGFDGTWLEAAVLARPARPTLTGRWALRLIAPDLRRLERAYAALTRS